MTKLSYKISYYILYILFALTLVVLGVFYTVGYDNPVGEYNSPENTELLIFFMYGMVGFCVVAALGSVISNVVSSLGGPKGVNISGVPERLISIVSLAILILSLIIAYAMGTDTVVITGDGAYTDVFWLKVTDMFIYAIYFLMLVATFGLLVNMTGIFKK